MRRISGRALASLGVAVFAVAAIAAACARDSSAQMSTGGSTPAPSDSASIAWLLRAVRGADPLLCELAVRNIDMNGSWHRDGLDGSPLETDSGAASVIEWVQEEHADPAVVPRLSAAMRDPDGCVRRMGASLLSRVKHPSARAALISALDDASANTRQVAALGVGLGEMAEAEPALTRRLRDDSPDVRRAAAWALGSLERPSAQDALIETLQRDPDARVRQTAAWAIGKSH